MSASTALLRTAQQRWRTRGGTAQDEGRQSEFWMIGGGVDERGIYNAVCFGERMVSAVSALLEDEVTLYHRCAAPHFAPHSAPR